MTCNDWNSTLNRNPKHGHKLEFLILWHEAEKKRHFMKSWLWLRSAFNQFSQKGLWLSARKTGTGMVEQMIQPRGRVRQNRTAFRVRWWFLWLRWNELQLHQDHQARPRWTGNCFIESSGSYLKPEPYKLGLQVLVKKFNALIKNTIFRGSKPLCSS